MSFPDIMKGFHARTAIVLALAVSAFFLVIVPIRHRIVSQNEEAQKAVVRMEHAREKVSRLSEFREQYDDIVARGPETSFLLAEPDVHLFIEELERYGRETSGRITVDGGGDLDALRAAAKKTKNTEAQPRLIDDVRDGKSLLLSVGFFGTYPDAAEFLHKVETMPYFLDVLSIDIRAVAPEDATPSGRVPPEGRPVAASSGTEAEPAISREPAGPLVEAAFSVAVYIQE